MRRTLIRVEYANVAIYVLMVFTFSAISHNHFRIAHRNIMFIAISTYRYSRFGVSANCCFFIRNVNYVHLRTSFSTFTIHFIIIVFLKFISSCAAHISKQAWQYLHTRFRNIYFTTTVLCESIDLCTYIQFARRRNRFVCSLTERARNTID